LEAEIEVGRSHEPVAFDESPPAELD